MPSCPNRSFPFIGPFPSSVPSRPHSGRYWGHIHADTTGTKAPSPRPSSRPLVCYYAPILRPWICWSVCQERKITPHESKNFPLILHVHICIHKDIYIYAYTSLHISLGISMHIYIHTICTYKSTSQPVYTHAHADTQPQTRTPETASSLCPRP